MGTAPSAQSSDRDANKPVRSRWFEFVVIVWALTMVAAFTAVWRYKTTPGPAATEAPATWPAELGLARAPGQATIVMLAHPKCPCTRASISELSVLMTRLGAQAHAYVLFMTPRGEKDGWERSDTWARASEIAGVSVIADRDGALAARLGATVSGHTVVYDANGRLMFYGGITSARGHAGDNAGRTAIVSRFPPAGGDGARETRRADATPTFGCELADAPTR